MRDRRSGHRDRSEPIELATQLLAFLPHEELRQHHRLAKGGTHGVETGIVWRRSLTVPRLSQYGGSGRQRQFGRAAALAGPAALARS